jgi:transposase InsO family protein
MKWKENEKDAKPSAEVTMDTASWTDAQWRKWLREEFELDKSPWLTAEEDREEALQLLLKFKDVFSVDGSFGKTELIQHDIITEKVPPIKQRYRAINPVVEKDLRKQLDKWLKHDVIEESCSPWSFRLVAAPKKGGKIRWCVDYRQLNEITMKDSFPLPSIEDNIARLGRSKIFSGIDGSGAFHVIPMTEEAKPKTAFATPWGLFQFKRMPFGLCNGPATYSRLVQRVLEGIPYELAIPYLDDTVIHSPDLTSHYRALDLVLEAHRKAGLRLQPSKCQLFQDHIEYLGHEVSADGIKPMKSYVDVVARWPLPTTKSLARTFLGKLGYYRRFIQEYSALARPWTDVSGKGTDEEEKEPLVVTPAMEVSFHELKEALLTAPILAYPQFDSEEPFILDTDWAQETATIGGVLSQKQRGIERVICYGAKKLNKTQARYSATKGELFGLLHFAQHWRYYLSYRRFLWRTDHQSLVHVKTMNEPAGITTRWLETLSNFDFEVEHRAGIKHGNADALSRIQHADPADPEELEDGEAAAAVLYVKVHKEQRRMFEPETAMTWTWEELLAEQEQDEDLGVLKESVTLQTPLTKLAKMQLSSVGQAYTDLWDSLELNENGLLCYRSQPTGLRPGQLRICLPQVRWKQALRQAHMEGAHAAAESTMIRLGRHAFFPSMRKEADSVVATCLQCQAKKKDQHDQKHTHIPVLSGYPFQKLSLDFVGPVHNSYKGNRYLLTIKDTFSKWVEAFPLKHCRAVDVVRALEKEIIPRFGVPEVLHSDQGSQFTGTLLKEVSAAWGIKTTTTPAYNPKSNAVERTHRDLGAALRAMCLAQPGRWEDALPAVLFAFRTAPHRSTGVAPFRLLFGRDAVTPLDALIGPPPDQLAETPASAYAAQLERKLRIAREFVRNNLQKAVRRQKQAYCQQKKMFEVGVRVWLFAPPLPGLSKKLSTYWTGPWTVKTKINEVMVTLLPSPEWTYVHQPTVAIDRLKLYYGPQQCPPEHGADMDMEGDEFAEMIIPPAPLRPTPPPPTPATPRVPPNGLDAPPPTPRGIPPLNFQDSTPPASPGPVLLQPPPDRRSGPPRAAKAPVDFKRLNTKGLQALGPVPSRDSLLEGEGDNSKAAEEAEWVWG